MTVIFREYGADYFISGQRNKKEAVLDRQFLSIARLGVLCAVS
jgi:hypothetical protein